MDFGDLFNSFLDMFLGGTYEDYPGSCFTAIAAAFATQGYWIHSDMLYLVGGTSFQHFVILIYLCAAIGGLVGMALGAPPKMYLWFFMGPPIYHFLVGTTVEVRGVAWRVAGRTQDMEYVGKLASTGINKDKVSYRLSLGGDEGGGAGFEEVYKVSLVFAEIDGLVSDTVQTLTNWMGVYSVSEDDDALKSKKWYLLSNLKWGFLDTITAARISTPALRYALVFFGNTECGRAFKNTIDPALLAHANNAENARVPERIFRTADTSAEATAGEYDNVIRDLNAKAVWLPAPFRELLSSAEEGGLQKALKDYNWTSPVTSPGESDPDTLEEVLKAGQMKCSKYLDLLVRGMRWEAGNIFTNLVGKVPNLEDSGFDEEVDPDFVGPPAPPENVLDDYAKLLVSSMLLGWDIQYQDDPFAETPGEGRELTEDQAQQYLVNLIFVHLLRNEFSFAGPNLNTTSLLQTSDQMSQNHVEEYQKLVGARSKYGEVYTWAMMMPYLQGVLLYILALGYPFMCMFMVIPGWHKIIFTWMSFWIWAKIWDLGFAIVLLLERSVWATLGNTESISRLNPMIAQMDQWGSYDFEKITGTTPGMKRAFTPYAVSLLEPAAAGAAADGAGAPDAIGQLTNSLRLLERSMVMFKSLDFDLQNSYYIYIMAALYFGVPAITGQLVLGAKAAVAGLATNAFTNMAQETGGKAGEGIRQMGNAMLSQNASIGRQALAFGDPKVGKLAAGVLGMQNERAQKGIQAQKLGMESQGLGNQREMIGTGLEYSKGLNSLGRDMRARYANPANMAQNYAGLFLDEQGILRYAGFGTAASPLGAMGASGAAGGNGFVPPMRTNGRPSMGGGATGAAARVGQAATRDGGAGSSTTGAFSPGALGMGAAHALMGSVYAQADNAATMAESGFTLLGHEVSANQKAKIADTDINASHARLSGESMDFLVSGPGARMTPLIEAFQQEAVGYGMADWQTAGTMQHGSLFTQPEMGQLSQNTNFGAANGYLGGEAGVKAQQAFEWGASLTRDSAGNMTGEFGVRNDKDTGYGYGGTVDSTIAGIQASYGGGKLLNSFEGSRAQSVGQVLAYGDSLRQGVVRDTIMQKAGVQPGDTPQQQMEKIGSYLYKVGAYEQTRGEAFGGMQDRMKDLMIDGAGKQADTILGGGSFQWSKPVPLAPDTQNRHPNGFTAPNTPPVQPAPVAGPAAGPGASGPIPPRPPAPKP